MDDKQQTTVDREAVLKAHEALAVACTPVEDDMQPGSEEWLRRVTASKIAGIMGVDPYGNTRYTLWHQMAGGYTPEPVETPAMVRGSLLESGVADWWLHDHPGFHMEDCGTFKSNTLDFAYATPDRLLVSPEGVLELLEVKTQSSWNGWGDDGSDVVPVHYWMQAAWQAIVTGVRRVHFAVLGPYLERRDFVVDLTDFELDDVVGEVTRFVDSLPGGEAEREPEVEDAVFDWPVVTAVTPVVEDAVDVSDLYESYRSAKLEEKRVKSEASRWQAEIKVAAAAGSCAVVGDRVVATRNGDRWRFSAVR